VGHPGAAPAGVFGEDCDAQSCCFWRGVFSIAALLAGCNPPTVRQQVAAVPCNCQGHGDDHQSRRREPALHATPAAADITTPDTIHGIRIAPGTALASAAITHGYQGSDEAYAREWSYSRVAMSSYDYRSSSRVYSGGSAHAYAYASAGDAAYGDGFVQVQDGGGDYERYHHARIGGRALAARMDPWRGYDVDCPDGDHHHGGWYDRHHH